MKRTFSVEIPTKKYIKAFIISKFGEKPLMNNTNSFGCKLHDLLQQQYDDSCKEPENIRFDCRMKLYISQHTFHHRGAFISYMNVRSFNKYCESQIKEIFQQCMDFYLEINPSFMFNLLKVKEKLGIDIDDWDDQSMQKDYYRYRKAKGRELLYNKDRSK